MKSFIFFVILIFMITIIESNAQKEISPLKNKNLDPQTKLLMERLRSYAPFHIKADLSKLDERQKTLIKKLCEAGHLADQIFWKQISPDAITVRDSMETIHSREAKMYYDYIKVNYGPYDEIFDGERFVGNGWKTRPKGGNFYPTDLTKEEFENYVAKHPEQTSALESQYTIVKRDNSGLKAIPYHEAYPEQAKLADMLEEAAQFADNETLYNYLLLRAKAIRNDDYFKSDMAWMNLKDSKIDVIIGPIENYRDELFNYKTAFEAIVMIKDDEATKELQLFNSYIDKFEQLLPYDKKYIRKSAGGDNNVLQIVNVVYFGGDCQSGIKTIASSLPNDPKVHELKGGKKTMFKNMMEAKFDRIVMPIARELLDPSLLKYVDKKAFTSFVTLHEVSHTLGPNYVYGKPDLDVRKGLKDRFSAIEEAKADILSMYNHKHLSDMKIYDEEYIKKSVVTYLAGLYRSIRFGAEAHGQSNLIQLNYLREQGAIIKQKDGKFNINFDTFFDKVKDLSGIILTIEATGDYDGAGKLLEKYGKMTPELQKEVDLLKNIPRDLNTSYDY